MKRKVMEIDVIVWYTGLHFGRRLPLIRFEKLRNDQAIQIACEFISQNCDLGIDFMKLPQNSRV